MLRTPMLSPGDHVARINGVELGYSISGQGPLLIVTSPGWGIGSAYLKHGLAPLLARFTIVFVDTRGSGRSTRPADPAAMSTATMADDLDGLRQQLGLESIDLLGHSHGGSIAISYAERYAGCLRRMVLVSSQLIGFDIEEEIRSFLERAAEDPRYRDAVPYVGLPRPRADADFRRHMTGMFPLYFHDPERNLQTFLDAIGPSMSGWASHALRSADASSSADQTRDLGSILADTLILSGRSCWISPVALSERVRAGIATSRLVVLERTAHFPWIEAPDVFFPEVEAFLGRA